MQAARATAVPTRATEWQKLTDGLVFDDDADAPVLPHHGLGDMARAIDAIERTGILHTPWPHWGQV